MISWNERGVVGVGDADIAVLRGVRCGGTGVRRLHRRFREGGQSTRGCDPKDAAASRYRLVGVPKHCTASPALAQSPNHANTRHANRDTRQGTPATETV